MISYNGVDLSPYVKVNDIRRDILPPAELTTETIPAKRGSLFFRRRPASRSIEVDVTIEGTSASDLRSKVRTLASLLNSDEPKSLVFSDEPTLTYYAILDGHTSLREVGSVAQGTLSFLCPDPYAEGVEKTASVPGKVTNGGTAASYPSSIKATLTADSTFLLVYTPDKFVLLGDPTDKETESEFVAEEIVLTDSCSTTTGWSVATSIPEDVNLSGSIVSNGTSFVQTDFGAATGARGGSLVKSFGSQVQDFRFEAELSMASTAPDQVGGIVLYLLDQNGGVISKLWFADTYFGTERNAAAWRLGPKSGGFSMWRTIDPTAWNNFKGMVSIEREGSQWKATISKIDTAGRHFQIYEKTYIDAEGLYTAKVAQVQVVIYGFSDSSAMAIQSIDQLRLWQINTPTEVQIPLIGRAGDVIEIDCERAVVTRNGQPFMQALAPESDFFGLPPGDTTVGVRPDGVATVQVTYKERWL